METLGQRIKRLRKSKGLSQQQLAEACGWSSQSRIGNYESDLREPALSDLLLLGCALPNIIGGMILAPLVIRKVKDYEQRLKAGKIAHTGEPGDADLGADI